MAPRAKEAWERLLAPSEKFEGDLSLLPRFFGEPLEKAERKAGGEEQNGGEEEEV